MRERSLPASPNWYCSRCSDVSSSGLLGVGAKNVIYLIDVSASSCRVAGHAPNETMDILWDLFRDLYQELVLVLELPVYSYHKRPSIVMPLPSLKREHAAHQSAVSALHWSPVDKNLVVSGDEKGVVVCHWYHTGDTTSFFPEPRTIFCLTCSPHTWNYVAVGYKDGMIVLIDVSKKGEVIHRLRGHDDEIHALAWSPLAHEDALCNRPEDGEATNGVSGGDGCYLASGSKDQTVRLWSTAKGQRWTLFGTSSEGQNHSRIVFNMSSVHLQDGRELLISTSMDREVKCWDLASLECCWTLPTLGGFVYALTFSPVGTGCLALGVGDNMIRVWNTLATQNKYDVRSFWQGIKSKVTALAWHPTKEGSLSFGTDDGKVGIYDVFSNKAPRLASTTGTEGLYGTPPPLSFGTAGGKASFSLYSCAGEGVILQHDPYKLNGEASDIDKLIRDTNDIKHKLSPHTDLSWKPDGKVVAIGNEDGCIDVYQAPSLKLLCSIQQHHKIINTLRWHHDHSSALELRCLLASGSSNAIVYVHDLRSVIENPPESPVVLTEPYRRLCGHTAKITGMAWSPHHDARLVTVSYDGTAQVWDVLEEAAVCNYRGHVGYLLCVDWSPVDPDVIWTGGKDFTLQEWSVSKQEFTKPPKGKKMVDLKEKMKANTKQKKKNKKAGPSGAEGAAQPEVNGAAVRIGERAVTGQGVSGEDDEDEASSTSSPAPSPATFEMQRKSSAAAKSKDKPDLTGLKKKKPRSMLPLSTSMDHRPKDELLQDCITLASVRHVLFAAPAGFVVWSRTVEAFVKQLCLQEQYLKAASHLLSINKLYEAVGLLRSHKLYREAIALVKARLPADEPLLKELYTCWAAVLEKDGHFSAAAKCYLAADASFDAAKVIARKNDVLSLRTAASLARISGEASLAQSLSLRCAKDLAAARDWVGAQEVLSLQDSLLVSSRSSQEIQNGLSLSLADSSPEGEVKDEVSNGGLLESAETQRPVSGSFHKLGLDPSLLLCEPHAACQATQRAVREIQQQLAAMVQQHSQTQGGQLDSGEKRDDSPVVISTTRESSDSQDSAEAEQGSEDPETLLSLSSKMSKHQKELAELPNTLKVYPHPDVVECCLVLLHLSKSSMSFSDSLLQEAKDLLRKYGTSPSVLKASQRLLI
ncbi:gem-associated protein 5 [Neolamprologus brichardi]|uniref:gem-associated protein 5 n=1 Tax=Neolamprologus brichardi TaxID=32507 RepID=UPI001643A5F1|nr:gem-associated protein 5 [Neolamprologus brichardi]